jgi:sRNA-binding carbon storage regulator CsrA
MLVLSRKTDERIVFTVTQPCTFSVVVLKQIGGKIKIGVDAGNEVQACRPEAKDKRFNRNRKAKP